jgi:hypothetical protein
MLYYTIFFGKNKLNEPLIVKHSPIYIKNNQVNHVNQTSQTRKMDIERNDIIEMNSQINNPYPSFDYNRKKLK